MRCYRCNNRQSCCCCQQKAVGLKAGCYQTKLGEENLVVAEAAEKTQRLIAEKHSADIYYEDWFRILQTCLEMAEAAEIAVVGIQSAEKWLGYLQKTSTALVQPKTGPDILDKQDMDCSQTHQNQVDLVLAAIREPHDELEEQETNWDLSMRPMDGHGSIHSQAVEVHGFSCEDRNR